MLLTKPSCSSYHCFRTSFPIKSYLKQPLYFAHDFAGKEFGKGMARQLALRCSQVVAVQGWLELQALEDLPAGPDVPASSRTCLMVMLLDGRSGGLLVRALWSGFSSMTDWGWLDSLQNEWLRAPSVFLQTRAAAQPLITQPPQSHSVTLFVFHWLKQS